MTTTEKWALALAIVHAKTANPQLLWRECGQKVARQLPIRLPADEVEATISIARHYHETGEWTV